MRLFSGAFHSWQVNNIAFSAKNLLRADKGIIYAGFSIYKPFFFFSFCIFGTGGAVKSMVY